MHLCGLGLLPLLLAALAAASGEPALIFDSADFRGGRKAIAVDGSCQNLHSPYMMPFHGIQSIKMPSAPAKCEMFKGPDCRPADDKPAGVYSESQANMLLVARSIRCSDG